MNKEVIRTDKAAQPGASYSQAVKSGNLVFAAGTTGIDPITNKLVSPGEMGPQTRQAMQNIKAILEESGTSLKNIIKTTVFISDLERFWEFDKEYRKFFTEGEYPARSTVEVKLPTWCCVEIEAVAIMP